jgi:hypothetical protein
MVSPLILGRTAFAQQTLGKSSAGLSLLLTATPGFLCRFVCLAIGRQFVFHHVFRKE